MADPPTEDPFEGWVLDDDFVKDAFRTEHSAEERVERLQRLDADLRRMPDDEPGRPGRSRPTGGGRFRRLRARLPRWWWVVLLLVIAVIAVEVYQRNTESSSEDSSAAKSVQEVFVVDGMITDLPTVPADVSTVPLGAPPAPPASGGTYEFVLTQPQTGEPVAYDPCRPIQVVINDLAAPVGSEGLVAQAVSDVAAATGLQFEIEGVTTEEPSSARPPVQKARYGDRWAPVLVSWTDPGSIAALEGDTVGVGGSQAVSVGPDQSVYVTGMVALDAPQLTDILEADEGPAFVRGVIAHELGHVAGLDHVDDLGELMAPRANGSITSYGPGDRTGLALLGAGGCFPEL